MFEVFTFQSQIYFPTVFELLVFFKRRHHFIIMFIHEFIQTDHSDIHLTLTSDLFHLWPLTDSCFAYYCAQIMILCHVSTCLWWVLFLMEEKADARINCLNLEFICWVPAVIEVSFLTNSVINKTFPRILLELWGEFLLTDHSSFCWPETGHWFVNVTPSVVDLGCKCPFVWYFKDVTVAVVILLLALVQQQCCCCCCCCC